MTAQLHVVSSPSEERKQILSDAKYLTERFCRECGFKILPYMGREFARYLRLGYEREMLEMVIDITARAPRPSFAYFDAVMRNAYDCKTVPDFLFHRRKPVDEDLPWGPSVDLDAAINAELDSMD
ncbi:MAG: hypothetical protein IJQ62_01845 [Clostridia bacterium]|nr:hypothetical protein [Clostridia bacterium]